MIKMTILDEKAKCILRLNGALVTNHEGKEVLVGLTVSESDFILTFDELEETERDINELVYMQLRHKHLTARLMQILAPDDAGLH
jgi:hypothetical protein